MRLGKKLEDALTIIKWAKELGIKNILIPFDAELEVQLWQKGFSCSTKKFRDGKYITEVA